MNKQGGFNLSRMFASPSKPVLALGILFILGIVGYWVTVSKPHLLYPYQQSYTEGGPNSSQFRIAVITDMDTASRVKDAQGIVKEWKAILKIGTLYRSDDSTYNVVWKEDKVVKSLYNEGGRGMELSELVFYNNQLLTCDDRTGILFELDIEQGLVYPRHIFGTGDGNQPKGFKCEWMFVRDDKLYVGSMGKDWTTAEGTFVNDHPNWVKIINPQGQTQAINWKSHFTKINQAVGISSPDQGWMVHEAVGWDASTNTWVFMPRRVAKEKYDEKTEGTKGSNHVFILDDKFSSVQVKQIGELIPTHGFSSFKFVPYRFDEVIALKTVEDGDTIESYITVFNLQTGKVLMKETKVGDHKFEGVEFI
jgi:soluble calcium-activated nucleotidase 1